LTNTGTLNNNGTLNNYGVFRGDGGEFSGTYTDSGTLSPGGENDSIGVLVFFGDLTRKPVRQKSNWPVCLTVEVKGKTRYSTGLKYRATSPCRARLTYAFGESLVWRIEITSESYVLVERSLDNLTGWAKVDWLANTKKRICSSLTPVATVMM